MGRGGKCSKQGKGVRGGTLRQTGAGVQEPAESRALDVGRGPLGTAGVEEKAQALGSQLCGPKLTGLAGFNTKINSKLLQSFKKKCDTNQLT